MARTSAHIAGVGISVRNNESVDQLAISAGTKALLDAGITYAHVDHSIACFLNSTLRIPTESFETFGRKGAPITELNNDAGLFTAVQYVRSGRSNCTLVVGLEVEKASSHEVSPRIAVVATVIISGAFLTSHAYLKDSSDSIRAWNMTQQLSKQTARNSNAPSPVKATLKAALQQASVSAEDLQTLKSQDTHDLLQVNGFSGLKLRSFGRQTEYTGTTGLAAICHIVWQLRGWTRDPESSLIDNTLYTSTSPSGTINLAILARSDGQKARTWEEVKNIRDGRERLGYNPAESMRDIYEEDLRSVRTTDSFVTNESLIMLNLPRKGGDRAALARL